MTLRRFLVAGAITAALVPLAGCGAAGPPPPPPGSGRSASDVAFLQSMLPHHIQAIAIASQARSRARSPEVQALATRIDLSHASDVAEMTTLLREWGEARPQPGAAGPLPIPKVGPEQLEQLAATTGPAFDRMFLQLLAAQHRGPLELARGELAAGRDPRVIQLAAETALDQQAEATEMQALLARV